MKWTLLISCGGMVFSAVALRADLVVVQKVDGIGHTGEMTLKVKGDKIRADVSPEVSTITEMTSGMITTLLHSQKAYMQINEEATRQLMERLKHFQQTQKKEVSTEPAKLKPTGKHETVSGYDTEIYAAESGPTTTTYWIAKNFPYADKLRDALKQMQKSPMASMARGMGKQPLDFPGVPVKTELDHAGQKLTTTIISVKEQPLDDADFIVPADYKALPSPAFGEAGVGEGPKPEMTPEPAK